MTKNKIVRYAANSALLAMIAAAGIGAYQLGTGSSGEKSQDNVSVPSGDNSNEDEELWVDTDTSQVEADFEDLTGTDFSEDDSAGSPSADAVNSVPDSEAAETGAAGESTGSEVADVSGVTSAADSADSIAAGEDGAAAETSGTAVSGTAAEALASQLNFSEDTLMDWPVHGNILLDYNMDQTVYFPTLDQYKLSPAIAVQAVEDSPVNASVEGVVYSVEESPETGTTVTMELGNGYQAIYGQLKDLAVAEGDTVEKGGLIGYVAAPTKYYSTEGSNLYFAMKKDGEPVDPIAYLP